MPNIHEAENTPNKHQIQKDFYTKQKEWKNRYRVEQKDGQKLQLRPACYNGIQGVTKQTEKPLSKEAREEAKKRIEEGRQKRARAASNAAKELPCAYGGREI